MKSLFAWFRRTPEISIEHARRRVARGAAYLDEVDAGWHRRLDLNTLALADGRSCVLGQLHDSFRAGLGRAGLFNLGSAPRASLSPVAYGFHCVRVGDAEKEQRDYALLDRAWQEEVRRRQREEESFNPLAPKSTRPGRAPQRSTSLEAPLPA